MISIKNTKLNLVEFVNSHNVTGTTFDPDKPTIGFARRFVKYKRGDLIFEDIAKLVDISQGNLQIVYAGKAPPSDDFGKGVIKNIIEIVGKLKGEVSVAFIPNYDMYIGSVLTSGVDVWMNTPRRPREASGTSGMKAAINGVPHFSIIDGWWYEAQPKGGWSIGPEPTNFDLNQQDDSADVQALYSVLKDEVLPDIADIQQYVKKMIEAIENAAFFNTHRMFQEYLDRAYLLK
jgi:starch phosphorylase|tara:strand:- start:745 stop:1443 length:699 start_codon:yes stop_codon:yes gene_type:complete